MSGRDLHERASALFLELRELPEEERTRRLSDAAVEDEALHREVSSLLEHDAGDGGPSAEDEGAAETPAVTGAPARIGPYRILRRLGQGGSGVVLLAEQSEPVRRRVAIKLVPHAAISPDLAARFEFERRALERTEHPNIARILDAGRTGDGLPYLVMDYVEGVSISEHCRRKGLGVRACVGLWLDVADAVQHAHQRGVIHRDLKPGNILVGSVGEKPTPRVLDFGIAKPTAGARDADSPVTIGQAMGTPAYMAPEQTGGRSVDTRADVYALGAVLYELVCGRAPIDATGDTLEVLRRVRDDVPAGASRVRAGDAAIAGTEALSRSQMADLDCILAKALEKDPERRYPTVGALIDDVKRLLRREPIEARPPTLRYRAARFAQRNRVLVASAALVTLALAVGVGGLTAGLIAAKRERREAIDQGDAQRAINQFLTDDLLASSSADQQGKDVTALDMLHRAAKQVDQRFPNRPLIAAAIHHTLGGAFTELGAFDDAERHLNRAVALRSEAAGPDAPDTVHSQIASASLLGQRQRPQEASRALEDVIRRARVILGADDPALYAAINDLGVVYEDMGRGKEAVELLREALQGRARLLGPHHPQVLVTMSNLAQGYDRVGDTARSLEMLLEALRVADSLPDQPHLTVLGLCNNIGATYQDMNRDKEAVPYLRRAAEMAGVWMGAENPTTLVIQSNLAGLEAETGDPERGAALYDGIAKVQARLLGPDAIDTLTARYGYWNSLRHAKKFDEAATGFAALLPDMVRALHDDHWLTIQTRVSLARTLVDSGRVAEAMPLAEEGARQFTALYGPDHARTKTAVELVAIIKAKLGAVEGAPKTSAR